jgi:hypothetical protein
MDNINQLVEMMKVMMENDEFFTLKAKMTKKAYDALVEEGFTKAQATQLVASQQG